MLGGTEEGHGGHCPLPPLRLTFNHCFSSAMLREASTVGVQCDATLCLHCRCPVRCDTVLALSVSNAMRHCLHCRFPVRCNTVLALSVSSAMQRCACTVGVQCDAALCLHCRCPSAMQHCACTVGVQCDATLCLHCRCPVRCNTVLALSVSQCDATLLGPLSVVPSRKLTTEGTKQTGNARKT